MKVNTDKILKTGNYWECEPPPPPPPYSSSSSSSYSSYSSYSSSSSQSETTPHVTTDTFPSEAQW